MRVLASIRRKLEHLKHDPALRTWLVHRALGLTKPEPIHRRRPPYLEEADIQLSAEVLDGLRPPPYGELAAQPPSHPVELPLAGQTVTIDPAYPESLFDIAFPDLETLLSLHRFAWLPVYGNQIGDSWLEALWCAWLHRYSKPDSTWVWHPYTAAERSVNILDFADRRGLPGKQEETLRILTRHVPVIAQGLEYFGDHYTGNHLSNNGRGLYRLGLALGWPDSINTGLKILLAEADRLFLPSGLLREGSSHYHLLVTRNYIDAWLAAKSAGRPERDQLQAIVARCLKAAKLLALPGGFPLVGDISPDSPPWFLTDLLGQSDVDQGWLAQRSPEDRSTLRNLLVECGMPPADAAIADGWVRGEFHEWSGLWHAEPTGQIHIPGHGHQDVGSAELHWRGVPLFVDPGRGRYGENGDAARYQAAAVHGGLQVDGADPFPINRAYYSPSYRARLRGSGCRLARTEDGISLLYDGFTAQGVGECLRSWRFAPGCLRIDDQLDPTRQVSLTRRLISSWPVDTFDGSVIVKTPVGRLKISADTPLSVKEMIRWQAYGEGVKAWAIEVTCSARSPRWAGWIAVQEI